MAEFTVVACPSCGKKYKIGADKLGKTFKCTGCETRFKAGEESAAIETPVPLPLPTEPPVMQEQTEPPAIESTTDMGTGGEPVSPPSMNYSDNPIAKPKTSGMAIASLVCGLLGCVPLMQFLAVLFGFLGLKKIKTGMAGGKGLAITGIILGVLGIIAYGVLGFAGYEGYKNGKGFLGQIIKQGSVAASMVRIGQSIGQYQRENEQHFPTDLATLWKADPMLTGKVFVDPSTTDTPAMNPDQLESGGHDSFVYVYPGPDMTVAGPTDLLLYEKTPNPASHQIMLLFGGGVVKSCTLAELPSYLNKPVKSPMK